MTIFLENKDRIFNLLNTQPHWQAQDIFIFTQNNRDLLGFYIREVIVFDQYIIEAVQNLSIKQRVFSISHTLSTVATTQQYTPTEVLKILEDVDKFQNWLTLSVLTDDCK